MVAVSRGRVKAISLEMGARKYAQENDPVERTHLML